ncbi:ice-binding family protein [Botryobacter ruber]|uniref:ice-binding family protein n=1 Tax=Botryobacter ruber TaxID=2171629 RepID=UPI000E0C08A3|nr:ice-binding family protein [Botryobacter ruber]
MNKLLSLLWCFLLAATVPGYAQLNPALGLAGSYGVLAGTQVNNTGASIVQGNLGVSPGNQIIDAASLLVVTGTRELGNTAAADAKASAREVYESHKLRPVTRVLPNQIGNGEVLTPGVYKINGNASLSGALVLNGAGSSDPFIFIIEDGTFTTAATTAALPLTRIDLQNLNPDNVYWIVEGSATIGAANVFAGNIMARESITLNAGVTLAGRAISLNSSVSLNTSNIILPGVEQADLSVQKTILNPAASYTIGSEVTYRVTVRNNGPDPAATVKVTENFPAQLQFVSATPGKGSYNQTAKEWQIGALQNGEAVTMDIVFRVASAGNNIVNRVTVESATPDAITANNQASSEPINAACVAPTLAITGQTDICLPTTNLTYSVTAVAGATYTFTLPNGWTPVALTGNTVVAALTAGASGGEIRATVTDACGNSYTTTKVVNVLTAPVAPVITGSAAVCANTETTYTATGGGTNVTYTWSGTGGLTVVSSNGNTATVRAGSTGGTLTVTSANACGTASSAPFAVAVTPTPATPGAITGAAAVCPGVEQTYSVTAVTGATAYVWTVPAGWQLAGASGTTITTTTPEIQVTPGTAGGNITVRAQNVNNCAGGTATRAVTVNPAAPARPGTITASTGACAGTQVTYSVAPVANATSYNWTLPAGWNAGNNTITATTTTPSLTVTVGSGAGEVKVKAANSCGTSDESSLAVTTATALGTIGAVSGPAEVCAATTGIQYSISPVAGATTYTWTPPAGWTITSGAGTPTITVSTGNTTGNVQLRVVASNSCGSASATATIITRTGLTVAGGITDNSSFCEGLSYSISAVAGAASYTWTVPAGFSITSGQGTTSVRVQQTTPGATGQVTVAANNGFCDGPAAAATIDVSLAEGDLNFPKAFSPNGDGTNDTWRITNLSRYTDNDIIIFNRLGTEVFRKSNYQNDWAGTGLEQGTYFYKARVRQCDGSSKDFTGYVSIYR